MKLRQFLSILGLVALVAVIYSPSTIGLSASPGGDGGTGPADTSSSGTSMFVSYLHQAGYHVTVANDSQQLDSRLSGQGKFVYVVIGADTALSTSQVQAIKTGFVGGRISALVAEGNSTNEALLLDAFGVSVSGHAIVDPASTFVNKQVFTVRLTLGSTPTQGVIDIASPLSVPQHDSVVSPLAPVAVTSPASYDLQNSTAGPRTVVAAGTSPQRGARAVVLTDSAPFTNYLFGYDKGGVNETAFVAAMLGYVDPGMGTPILLDASHYNPPSGPTFRAGLPIGPLVAYGIEQSLSGLNGYYASFPSQVSGFLGGMGIGISEGAATALVAALILLSVYGAITRWFAPEKRGRDDRPAPVVELSVVAQSRARTDFLQTSRSKEGYLAALSQLCEVLDSIVLQEFGSGLLSVDEGALASKVGSDDAREAKKLFLSLSRLREYASGERRFLFPPVLRWRTLTERTTRQAEAFLNRLGITIAGEEAQGRRVDLLMRERVRA